MNNKKQVPIKKALSIGWNKTINNLGFFIGIVLIVWIIGAGPGFLSEKIGDNFPITSLILAILGGILSVIIDMGLIKIGLDFIKSKGSKIKELFLQYPKFWKYLGAIILYLLIILGGLILLIVPGIIWAIKYQFFGYFIIDKDSSIKEAIKKSGEITKGAKWDLFLFDILILLINSIGVLTFGIGLIFTVPTTQIAMAYVYKKLS